MVEETDKWVGLLGAARATAGRPDRLLPARIGPPLGDRAAALEPQWARRQSWLRMPGLLSWDRQSTASRPMALPADWCSVGTLLLDRIRVPLL